MTLYRNILVIAAVACAFAFSGCKALENNKNKSAKAESTDNVADPESQKNDKTDETECSEGEVADVGILSGKTVKEGSWIARQTVYITAPNNGYCTATLIAPDVLLTAAHCVAGTSKDLPNEESSGLAGFGAHPKCLKARGLQKIYFRETIANPKFQKDPPVSGDVALIRLHSEAPRGFVPGVVASSRIFAQISSSETTYWSAGYGKTQGFDIPDRFAARLRVASMKLIPNYDPNGNLAFDQKNSGFCSGDSGGPTFAKVDGKAALVGVNSNVFTNDPKKEVCKEMGLAMSIEVEREFLKRAFAEIAPERKNPF